MTHQPTIGIVGLGYWGKIILRNLRQLGYKNITVCEKDDIDWHDMGQICTFFFTYFFKNYTGVDPKQDRFNL